MSLQDVLLNLCGTVIPIITLKCLFLKPEGVEQYFSQTLFLEMEPEKRNKSTALSFSFPPNVVPGSQRARVVLAGKSAVCPLTVRACSLFTLSHLGMYHSRKASVGIFLSYRFQVQLVLIVSCRINVSSCRTAASCSVRLVFFPSFCNVSFKPLPRLSRCPFKKKYSLYSIQKLPYLNTRLVKETLSVPIPVSPSSSNCSKTNMLFMR